MLDQLLSETNHYANLASKIQLNRCMTADLSLDKPYRVLVLKYMSALYKVNNLDNRYIPEVLIPNLEKELKSLQRKFDIVSDKIEGINSTILFEPLCSEYGKIIASINVTEDKLHQAKFVNAMNSRREE